MKINDEDLRLSEGASMTDGINSTGQRSLSAGR